METADPERTTTTTADPGAGGTTLAVTSAAKFPTGNNYKVKVDQEVMLVTAGGGTTSWTVTRAQDGTTGVAHSIGATVSQVVGVQYVTPVAQRQTLCKWTAATFRTLGSAASGQNLMTIENQASSARLLAVRWFRMEMDATAVLTAVAIDIKTGRTSALPTGGTTLTKTLLDTTQTSASTSVARGATASDGGAATAITATLASTAWHQYGMRLHTAVGQVLPDDWNLIPQICDTDPIILRAGQAISAQVVSTAGSNAATNHYVLKAFVEEFIDP
jgi:hypothetical protein